MTPLRVGLIGLGVVASGLVELLQRDAAALESRTGRRVEVTGILVRDPHRPRALPVMTDPDRFLAGEYDVVVELAGGLAVGEVVAQLLRRGVDVVTANKALLATRGPELAAIARWSGARIRFEASVAGAIPVIRTLQRGLAGSRIDRIEAILNGTTNFILTRLERGAPYADALAEAQARGFAEADPRLDVEGGDAAHKLVLLASLAFGLPIDAARPEVTGIVGLTPEDLAAAGRFDHRVKLLAVAERTPAGISLSVRPTLVPRGHPLAGVEDEYNAVVLFGEAFGDLLLYGKGAGALPTAASVYADLIDLATSQDHLDAVAEPVVGATNVRARRWLVRTHVADVPGALGRLTTAIGVADLSIDTLHADRAAGVDLIVGPASEAALRAALPEARILPFLDRPLTRTPGA